MQTSHIVAVILILLVVFILWTAAEQKLLATTRYIVMSEKLPKTFDHTSFVILADLHNNNFGMNNERLISKIEKLKPEFIVMAGDIINKGSKCSPSNALTLMEQLAANYKIFYAYGNHEQRLNGLNTNNDEDKIKQQAVSHAINNNTEQKHLFSSWTEYKNKLTKLGVIFLDNKSTFFIKNGEKLRITGVSIDKKFFEHTRKPAMEKGYLNTLIGNSKDADYQILIAHNPVYFKEYIGWGADLILSGHLHGGLVRLPGIGGMVSPQVSLFPKYDAGIFSENGHQMVVSRGLGSHSIMPRIFNAPEIVSVTLISK